MSKKINFVCKNCKKVIKLFSSVAMSRSNCSRKCMSEQYKKSLKGKNNPNFKGKIIRTNGYVSIYTPDHPLKDNKNHVLEHRLIMEKHLGRYLDSKEVVHHKNKIKDDNRLENLELFDNHSNHMKIHKNRLKVLIS